MGPHEKFSARRGKFSARRVNLVLGGAVVAEEVADLQDRGEAARDEDDSEPILLLMDPVHDHLGHVSRGLVEDETYFVL